jgi:hypothetical protein
VRFSEQRKSSGDASLVNAPQKSERLLIADLDVLPYLYIGTFYNSFQTHTVSTLTQGFMLPEIDEKTS